MTNKERYLKLCDVFNKEYSEAECALNYNTPFRLLVAVQLSAQCTDARVNIVTPSLFKKFPDVKAFAEADIKELETAIHSIGFYHNKAKNLKGCAQMLLSEYGGEVPSEMEDLLKLPGVGRKTANLIRGDIFGKGGIVVDTHAGRIARRMGFTKNTDPVKVEHDLEKIIPRENQTRFCHQLVLHGRKYCMARKPLCSECPAEYFCPKKI